MFYCQYHEGARDGWEGRSRADRGGSTPSPDPPHELQEPSTDEGLALIRKIELLSNPSTKLMLLRNFAEKYAAAKSDSELARQKATYLGLLDEAAKEMASLSGEIERLREALRLALIPIAALVVSGEIVNARSSLSGTVKQAIAEAHDAILAALAPSLPTKGES